MGSQRDSASDHKAPRQPLTIVLQSSKVLEKESKGKCPVLSQLFKTCKILASMTKLIPDWLECTYSWALSQSEFWSLGMDWTPEQLPLTGPTFY